MLQPHADYKLIPTKCQVIRRAGDRNSCRQQKGQQKIKQAVEQLAEQVSTNQKTSQQLEQITDQLDSNQLFQQVDHILEQSVQNLNLLPRWHQRLDHIFLHPFWGMLTLIIVMLLMFQAVYAWAAPFMDGIEAGFSLLSNGWHPFYRTAF